MRTTIDIDPDLLAEAMRATGQTTKRATIDEALKMLLRLARQRDALERLRGIGWEGDLDAMREGRRP